MRLGKANLQGRLYSPNQMETIEIGLVVIDLESLEIVDEFQRFVRPQIKPTLTDFCKKLTSIQQADVDGARTYQEVGEELRTFAARYPMQPGCHGVTTMQDS